MSGDEAWFNKEQRELKQKRLLLKVLDEVHGRLQGAPMGKSSQPTEGKQRKRMDLGHMALLELIDGVLWGSYTFTLVI